MAMKLREGGLPESAKKWGFDKGLKEDQHGLEAIIKQELDNGVIEPYVRNHLYYHTEYQN